MKHLSKNRKTFNVCNHLRKNISFCVLCSQVLQIYKLLYWIWRTFFPQRMSLVLVVSEFLLIFREINVKKLQGG